MNADARIGSADAVIVASQKARELGIDPDGCKVTISLREGDSASVWHVNYGPRDHVGWRGGDLIMDVDPQDASIRQVLRGQ